MGPGFVKKGGEEGFICFTVVEKKSVGWYWWWMGLEGFGVLLGRLGVTSPVWTILCINSSTLAKGYSPCDLLWGLSKLQAETPLV